MAILKIRDDKGVITNIAAIRGENGKSPIIKNGTWWTYDDELEDYIDTGLGAEKESVVTKANVEKVLTGTIDSHNHDNVYIKDAPSDSKQYVRYNGEWNAIDLSSVNPYDASWALNNTATQDQINELVDALNNKRRITIEPIDPDIVSDGNDNIYIGITSQAENSFISIYINKSTGNITYGYRMLPALDDVEAIKPKYIDHIPTENDTEFTFLYDNNTMPYPIGSVVYHNDKFYRLNSITDGKADWRELVDANSTITEISKEDINYITSIEPGTTLTDEQYNKLINIISGQVAFNILEVGILAYVYKSENEDDLVLSIAYYSPYNVCMNLYINKITKVVAFISQDINRIHSSPDGLYIYSEARESNDTNTESYVFNALLINKGDGTKYLADNGKYQTVIVPTKTSELTNDSGYLVNSDIANLATKDEVSTKVDKVSGKGLSTNDYTTDEKNKLAGIAAGAEVNVNADWTATSGDAMILNKPTIPSKTSQLTNDSDYITSSAVDTKISSAIASVYRVKGTVSNYSSLPTSNVTIGDVYNLSDTGANYVCTATSPITWDKLSETVDLSSYSTTEQNDAKYQLKGDYITSIPDEYVTDTELEAKGYATTTSVEAALATKLDSSVYTAYDILNKINTVDGEGSGLDADTLDGKDSTEFVLNSDINDLRLAIQVITPELKASLVNLESEDESLKTAAIDYIINLMPQNSMTIFVINNFAEEDIANYISNSITTEIIRANLGAENTDTIYIKYEFPTTFNAPSIYPIYNRQYSINISTKTLQKQISAFCYLDDELEYVVVDSERSLNKEVYIPTKNNLPTYLFSNINEVTTLTSMPIDKYNIKATVTEATTISFIGTPAEGMEYMIEVLNSSSSDITQPIPTDGTWQSDYSNIVLTAGRVTSISIKYIHGKYLVRV